jgi:CRP-like cAMP-binding protein
LRLAAQQELLTLGAGRTYPNQATILRHGDAGEHAVLLLDSAAKVVVHTPEGFDALLGIRVGGDLVGELSVIDRSPRSANIVSCGDIRVRIIGRGELEAFLRRTPDAAYEISRMIGERLRFADQRRIDFVARASLARIARVLVEIAQTYGRGTDDRWDLGVPLTQAELGSLAGTARRTVEKQLARLSDDGLVELSYRRVTLLNVTALRRVAGLV